MNEDENLKWIVSWFVENCDGYWEHENQIKIYTIDNPGWALDIDLLGTDLENLELEYTLFENSELDWFGYSVKNSKFSAIGGPSKLLEIINVFKKLVENSSKSN